MARADDLTDLLTAAPTGPGQSMSYRQGVILTFNKATLANTVQVGGSILTNVPVLGVAEAASLGLGSVVGLMVVGGTWAIIGRLVTPGTSEATDAITQVSQRTYSVTVPAPETRNVATWGDLATVGPVVPNVLIGASGRCLVLITSTIILLTADGGGEMAYEISGATIVPTGDTPPALAYYGPVGSGPTATRLVLQEGLNPGLHTFTAKYLADMTGAGLARFGGRNLTVMAL